MRKTSLATVVMGAGILVSSAAAHAQFFNFSTSFLPNPQTTTVSGNSINIANGSVTNGDFAGASGTDITTSIFTAITGSTTTGTFNNLITEAITLTATDSSGNQLAGDAPIVHTFTANYSGSVDSNSVSTLMTGLPTAFQTYTFADGSVFQVRLVSYSGPGTSGTGSMGAHVNGALAGVPQNTPEPGSIAMLFGMGLSGGVFAYRRRLRRA